MISRLVNNSFSKAAAFPKVWKVAEVMYPKKETQRNQPTTG